MDLQEMIDAMMVKIRQDQLKESPVLLLGELISRLEVVADQTKPIIYDFAGMNPSSLDSWRGGYAELALGYQGEKSVTVADILHWLRHAVGETFTGYKGGEFKMGRGTPVWVANYGDTGVNVRPYSGATVAIVGVREEPDHVVLQTKAVEE